jgi:hypothetical protein
MSATTALHGLFGGVFGVGDSKTTSHENDATLATYMVPTATSKEDAILQQRSLADLLTEKWVRLFQTGTIQLTTPVDFVTAKVWEAEEGVESVEGVQLLFRKRTAAAGYKKAEEDDEKAENDGTDVEASTAGGSSKKKKKDEAKEGGVEILIERLAGSNQVRVRARRCEVEDGTIIKEMSEETIINELGQAIDAWKKEAK